MQTDSEHGSQTPAWVSRVTDKPQDSEWEASPTQVTLPLVGLPRPLASGSLTDTPSPLPHPPHSADPNSRMSPDLPTLSDLDGWPPHIQSPTERPWALLSPPPHNSGQNFQDSDRPRRCRPTPGQTQELWPGGRQHRHWGSGGDTETQHAGMGRAGVLWSRAGGRDPAVLPLEGPRGQQARPGQQRRRGAQGAQGAGGWWWVPLSLPGEGVLT